MEKLRTNCHYCGYLCGFIASVEDGMIVDLEPDESRYPYDPAIANSCHRWRLNMETLDGPDRINHPLKRVGERGSGEFEQVTWDEALDGIASRLEALIDEFGPQTLASAIGGPHATYWPLHRFMNLVGSPNNMGIGQICWNPRNMIDCLTYGWPMEADIRPDVSGAVFLWGTNPAASDNSVFWRQLVEVSKSSTKLVVIDPRLTETARIADLHLAPFPGTDCTLALGMIHEIIALDRVDHEFIDRWCHGFEGLKAHVERYTTEYVESVTGVPAADVTQAAIIFSQPTPSALLSGRGIDQIGENTAPNHRAIAILRAITGDVDRPGAMALNMMSDFIPEIDMEMSDGLVERFADTQLNAPFTPLQSYRGFDGMRALTLKQGKRLPERYLTSDHPFLVWNAAVTGEPYPVKALIVMAGNPLVTYANTKLVHEAFEHLDLIVVLEYYMTPTAAMADYVLPSAAAMERPVIQIQGGISNLAYGGPAAVAPYYERKTDYEFFRLLGLRMGQEEFWPQESLEEAFDVQFGACGMTWEDFCSTGLYCPPAYYGKQEWRYPGSDEPIGFSTTTGKVELRNEYLISLGATEFPEPVSVDDDLDLRFAQSLGLPTEEGNVLGASGSTPTGKSLSAGGELDPRVLRLITGARVQPYWASSLYNIESFRRRRPEPQASMSAKTLAAAGISDGEWIVVRTSIGEARFVAKEASMVDGVISVDYGWWYPETDVSEPNLGGIWQSNSNLLTSGDIETSEPLIGSWKYNGILCEIAPSSDPRDSAKR
ncbi:MAG: molybdopterin-dependent oxidoreductase [Coriobacteriales bacterium]|nr:molybdopterin-dependent oxidoreductase [Coriobacteriales bacterium]